MMFSLRSASLITEAPTVECIISLQSHSPAPSLAVLGDTVKEDSWMVRKVDYRVFIWVTVHPHQ